MSERRTSRRASATGRLAVVVAVAVLLGTTLSVPIRNWFGQRAQIAALEQEYDTLTTTVADLEIQKERWEDPAFIAAEARRRLHFVYPGEVGFIAIGEEIEAQMDGTPVPPEHPWHIVLWQSVEAVDRGAESD